MNYFCKYLKRNFWCENTKTFKFQFIFGAVWPRGPKLHLGKLWEVSMSHLKGDWRNHLLEWMQLNVYSHFGASYTSHRHCFSLNPQHNTVGDSHIQEGWVISVQPYFILAWLFNGTLRQSLPLLPQMRGHWLVLQSLNPSGNQDEWLRFQS